MNDYLVFQLHAPLVAWGVQAVGQERPSEDHPGRSALLGLLAAALGIDRADEAAHQTLSEACRFGIKQYTAGLALRDFHTAQVPPENRKARHRFTRRDELREERLGTILSFRTYYQDSLHVVALVCSGDTWSTQHLKDALCTPHFHLYLGRKSCPPALPLNPQVVQAENLKAALDNHLLPEEMAWLARHGDAHPRYYWEEMPNSGLRETYRAPRYDQPLSRQRWQFDRRDELVYLGE